MAREPTNSEEHDHETCFCSCIGAGLCGRFDGRLCPRRRSWRGPWLCARRRHGPRIRSRFWQPGTADARFRKPDSGPARGTTAAPRDQRADVAAVAPGHVSSSNGQAGHPPAGFQRLRPAAVSACTLRCAGRHAARPDIAVGHPQSAFTTRHVRAGAPSPHPHRAVERAAFCVRPRPTPYQYPPARLST